jgi:post-segregation antitoxin (ccd killing protein)
MGGPPVGIDMALAQRDFYDRSAGKKTVSLTINADLTRRVREAGINASQVAEEALAARLEQQVRESLARAAAADIEACNAYVEAHGLFADLMREHERTGSGDAEPV